MFRLFIYNALPSIFDLHVYMFTSERFRKAKIKLKHVYSRRKSTSHPFRPWAELRRLSVNSRCSANLIYSLSPLTENPVPSSAPLLISVHWRRSVKPQRRREPRTDVCSHRDAYTTSREAKPLSYRRYPSADKFVFNLKHMRKLQYRRAPVSTRVDSYNSIDRRGEPLSMVSISILL